jgi:hypothetical protein
MKDRPSPLLLIDWTAPDLEIVEETTIKSLDCKSATIDLQPRQLRPARRFVLLDQPRNLAFVMRVPSLIGFIKE